MKWAIPVSTGDMFTLIDGEGSAGDIAIGESVRVDVNHADLAVFGVAGVPSITVPEGYMVRLLVDVTTDSHFAIEIVNESAEYVGGQGVDYTWTRRGMF